MGGVGRGPGDVTDLGNLIRYGMTGPQKDALAYGAKLPGAPSYTQNPAAADRYASGYLFGQQWPSIAEPVTGAIGAGRYKFGPDVDPALQAAGNAGAAAGVAGPLPPWAQEPSAYLPPTGANPNNPYGVSGGDPYTGAAPDTSGTPNFADSTTVVANPYSQTYQDVMASQNAAFDDFLRGELGGGRAGGGGSWGTGADKLMAGGDPFSWAYGGGSGGGLAGNPWDF